MSNDPLDGQPTAVRVDLWKQAAINGNMTDEEARQALAYLRRDRHAAAELGKKRKAAAGPISLASLEDELNSL